MTKKIITYKAVSLISGGLDSMLATQIIMDQGIYVEGINFYTGFCDLNLAHKSCSNLEQSCRRNDVEWVGKTLGIKINVINVVDEYKDIVANPKYGYGKNINPCLDCKIFMVKKAYEWMQSNNFDFIITGEVIGQRPMSQLKNSMNVVFIKSGAKDLLLRPLSAKNLAPTLPEINNWVDREKLYGISGRGRKPQIELAKFYGFADYAQPSGGCCLLINKTFKNRLKDLWQYQGIKDYTIDDILILTTGRHLRINQIKFIIGRNSQDNNILNRYTDKFITIYAKDYPGPIMLIEKNADQEAIVLGARMVSTYGKGKKEKNIKVSISYNNESSEILIVEPFNSMDHLKQYYVD